MLDVTTRSVAKTEKTVSTSLFPEKRQAEAQRIRDKYPDRIPVSRLWCNIFPFPYLLD